MNWNLGTELAVVLVSGIIGFSGIIIAALITRKRPNTSEWDGVERRIPVCPEHSGVMATIKATEEAMRIMHEDMRALKDEMSSMRESMSDDIRGLRDSIRVLMKKMKVEE